MTRRYVTLPDHHLQLTLNMISLLLLAVVSESFSLEITPYLPPGVSPVVTVTTTPQDFDNERFSLVSQSLLEDSAYDFRLKFEETVHVINPTITTEMIYMTEPRYVSGNPLTVGILDSRLDKDEKYYI